MLTTLLILLFGVSIVTRISSRIRKAFDELRSLPEVHPETAAHAADENSFPGEPYFSYETAATEGEFGHSSVEPPHVVMPASAVVPQPDDSETDGFDLRRAVIHQTILHNPFWAETRQ
ncbi:MAG: hypothetical protein AUK63_826 [bacterium P3]|nr:MAG: hypothetical protein AUK63_826 [bacterium P3]KWW41452.1 MAG: hypothetical protein F083_1014 [bacterium F083]